MAIVAGGIAPHFRITGASISSIVIPSSGRRVTPIGEAVNHTQAVTPSVLTLHHDLVRSAITLGEEPVKRNTMGSMRSSAVVVISAPWRDRPDVSGITTTTIMKRGITHVPELESYREGVSGEVVNTYN